MKEAPVPPKRRFSQEPHGVTTQKTPFFIVTAVKTSNLTKITKFKFGLNKISGRLLGIHEKVYLPRYMKRAVLWINIARERNCPCPNTFRLEMFHIKFQQSTSTCL
jgi:hypothetical protein